MGAPAYDAWALLQPQHHFPQDDRADCLELFAGHANISAAFAKKKKTVLEPRDLKYNHDLRCVETQEEVVNDIWKYKPRRLWAAWLSSRIAGGGRFGHLPGGLCQGSGPGL